MYFASGLVCWVGWPFGWCWSSSHWVTCFVRALSMRHMFSLDVFYCFRWDNDTWIICVVWNSVVLRYFEHDFVINLPFRCKFWYVWEDLCCNLWAHLRVCAILKEREFYGGFTRGTISVCRIGLGLPSNEEQCIRAQFFGWFRHIHMHCGAHVFNLIVKDNWFCYYSH